MMIADPLARWRCPKCRLAGFMPHACPPANIVVKTGIVRNRTVLWESYARGEDPLHLEVKR